MGSDIWETSPIRRLTALYQGFKTASACSLLHRTVHVVQGMCLKVMPSRA